MFLTESETQIANKKLKKVSQEKNRLQCILVCGISYAMIIVIIRALE
jgi:hypothetical protein